MNEPTRPRESAKQIAARIMRGEKPDPALISNVNERRKELKRLRAMPDSEIDTSDIPEVTDWSGAERGRFQMPPCNHYPIMCHGEIICRDCKAFSIIDMSGQHWVEKAK